MNKTYFRLFIRTFFKQKTLNFLNVLGLSLGVISATLIMLYIDHEHSYDNYHLEADNIYRLEATTNDDQWFSSVGVEHARELNSGLYPEVNRIVQINPSSRAFVQYGDQKIPETDAYQTTVGSGFFELFHVNVLEGNPRTFLAEPHNVVLTNSTAAKYFGDQSALGESFYFDSTLLIVTGVIEDIPTNSHLQFSLIYTNPDLYSLDHFHTHTYIHLVSNTDPGLLEDKILEMDVAFNEFHKLSDVKLMPLTDIHLSSEAVFGSGGKGDKMQLVAFLIMGSLILLISVTNYVNLSLAELLNKGREVGIRKVFGESRFQIIRSFFIDSVMLGLFAIPIVMIGLIIFMPVASQYLGVNLEPKLLSEPVYWVAIPGLLISVNLITVIYPSASLNLLNIDTMIKTRSLIAQKSGVRYRNLLLFVQFILLFTLGISAWFMNQQVRFLDDKDMGFHAEDVLKIGNAFEIGSYANYQVFKNSLLAYPQIESVAFGPMMGDGMNPLAYKPEGSDEVFENLLSYGVGVDYFDVMGMNITAGNFKEVLSAANNGHIVSLVNRSFIKRFGWEDDPIGKKIILRPGTENELHRTVSAVFEDFHFFSLKEKITPQIISLRPDPQFVNTNILIKMGTSNAKEIISIVEDEWYKIQPELPMEYTMMDDSVRRLYAKERQAGQVSVAFSFIAIALSLMGITGFTIYIIGLKSKEIAVRKVLGAVLFDIIRLLNKQLFLPVLIAALIGGVLSFMLVQKWLEDYAYAIRIQPQTFILATLFTYAAILLIITFQSIRSTETDPILALRDK